MGVQLKSHSISKIIIGVISVILCALLIINFSRKLYGGADLSFSAFLNWLGNVESFNYSINIKSFSIGGDWGIVDGVRKFFNIFSNLFGVIVYFGANLVNLLLFFGQFLVFVFI